MTSQHLIAEIPRKQPYLRQYIYRFPNGCGLSVIHDEALGWESCPIWDIDDSGAFRGRDDPNYSGVTEDEMAAWVLEQAALNSGDPPHHAGLLDQPAP